MLPLSIQIVKLYHFSIARSFLEVGFQAKGTTRLRRSHCSDIWQSPSVLFLSPSVSLIVNSLYMYILCFSLPRRSNRSGSSFNLDLFLFFPIFILIIYESRIYYYCVWYFQEIHEILRPRFTRIEYPWYTKTIPEIYRKNVKN